MPKYFPRAQRPLAQRPLAELPNDSAAWEGGNNHRSQLIRDLDGNQKWSETSIAVTDKPRSRSMPSVETESYELEVASVVIFVLKAKRRCRFMAQRQFMRCNVCRCQEDQVVSTPK